MKEDICKHCFQPISEHQSESKCCPIITERGHFIHWDKTQTFEGINIFKELERLKNWQKDAVVVLNKWYKVSDFLAKNNLVGLGEDYSTKCLDVLKSFTEQVENLNHQLSICTLLHKQKDKDTQKLKKAMRSIILCLAAHPDNGDGSEFADMISIGHKALDDEHI